MVVKAFQCYQPCLRTPNIKIARSHSRWLIWAIIQEIHANAGYQMSTHQNIVTVNVQLTDEYIRQD